MIITIDLSNHLTNVSLINTGNPKRTGTVLRNNQQRCKMQKLESVEKMIKNFPKTIPTKHIEGVTNICWYCQQDFIDKYTAITNDKGAVCCNCLKENNYKYKDKFGMFSK